MSPSNGPRPTSKARLTFRVSLITESDQRSALITKSQLDAILALLASISSEVGS